MDSQKNSQGAPAPGWKFNSQAEVINPYFLTKMEELNFLTILSLGINTTTISYDHYQIITIKLPLTFQFSEYIILELFVSVHLII